MNAVTENTGTGSQVSQILWGLERLPPEKVAVVNDFVSFLRSQHEIDAPSSNGDLASFEREVATFEALDAELQKRYAGKVVAIYQGQIVAEGDSKLDVLDEVLATLGPVSCYIDWVKPDGPRRVRVPSVWIAR